MADGIQREKLDKKQQSAQITGTHSSGYMNTAQRKLPEHSDHKRIQEENCEGETYHFLLPKAMTVRHKNDNTISHV